MTSTPPSPISARPSHVALEVPGDFPQHYRVKAFSDLASQLQKRTQMLADSNTPLGDRSARQIEYPSPSPSIDGDAPRNCSSIAALAERVCKKIICVCLNFEQRKLLATIHENSSSDKARLRDYEGRVHHFAEVTERIIQDENNDLLVELQVIEAHADLLVEPPPSQTAPSQTTPSVVSPAMHILEGAQINIPPTPLRGSPSALPEPITMILDSTVKTLADAARGTVYASALKFTSGLAMTAVWLSGLGMSLSTLLPGLGLGALIGLSTAGTAVLGVALLTVVSPIATYFNNTLWAALKYPEPAKEPIKVTLTPQPASPAKT